MALSPLVITSRSPLVSLWIVVFRRSSITFSYIRRFNCIEKLKLIFKFRQVEAGNGPTIAGRNLGALDFDYKHVP
jgi:hypothetical protein